MLVIKAPYDFVADLYRGCYENEFGVDPDLIGCHEQAGATWCFCRGDLCNNRDMADY